MNGIIIVYIGAFGLAIFWWAMYRRAVSKWEKEQRDKYILETHGEARSWGPEWDEWIERRRLEKPYEDN